MILRDDRTVQLIDFGISSFFENPNRSRFAGTRKYAAPEQHSGELVDERTDVYGLGVVFKNLLASVKGDSHDRRSQQRMQRATAIANHMTGKRSCSKLAGFGFGRSEKFFRRVGERDLCRGRHGGFGCGRLGLHQPWKRRPNARWIRWVGKRCARESLPR